jgi:hypothetical protein
MLNSPSQGWNVHMATASEVALDDILWLDELVLNVAASVEQLDVQSALYTPYSFIYFIGFIAMGNTTCFPISKPFLVTKSTIYD